ncbi:MAG: phenylalanine--tRNA ligase subunit beta [Deltaproteobacteria bacterium]|nr:phenylalanine--tRNA ligase subunit beta [Deltaproteobacteria bacterium]MBI4373988.1 phenylalanine--tRNA ligase subunit beta [Deltaproteobacteria bacterium]
MKVPVPWLKEFVPFSVSVEKLAERLTLSGFEVESISEIEGDLVLDIAVMPHRGDALSIRGIAREVAAILGRRIRSGPAASVKIRKEALQRKTSIDVDLRAGEGCRRYLLRVIRNVNTAPSPEWLQRRLLQCGLRSINNVVDLTNYIMFEIGQPLHAFDLEKIGSKIFIRHANAGENFSALDGKSYKLESRDLVIADSNGPIALAGIIGGAGSEVSLSTRHIALESAFFNPQGIRRTARRLGIQTESSFRFERRVDPEAVSFALERTSLLLQKIASGEPSIHWIDRGPKKSKSRGVLFDPESVGRLMGNEWPVSKVRSRLHRLGFVRKKGKRWSVPSYRGDIHEEVDLIEEAVRLEGYDSVPTTIPTQHAAPEASFSRQLKEEGRRWLSNHGFFESIHLPFLSPKDLEYDPELSAQALPLANPLGADDSWLRPSLVPSLLKTASYHEQNQLLGYRGFELRSIYRLERGRETERDALAVVMSSARLPGWNEKRPNDFFDLKGILQSLARHLGVTLEFEPAEFSSLLPHAAEIRRNGETIGFLGELHPRVLTHFNLKTPLFLFELFWGSLVQGISPDLKICPYSRVPQVQRDLALIVDEKLPAGAIEKFLGGTDRLVKSAVLFDLYEGPQIPKGKKSLAFSLQLGQDNTLTDEEIRQAMGRIIESLRREFHADRR